MSHSAMVEDDDILDFGEFSDSDEVFEPNQVDIAELEKELGITSIGETFSHSSISELTPMDLPVKADSEAMVTSIPNKSCDTTTPPVTAPHTNNRNTSLSCTKPPSTITPPPLSSDDAAVGSIKVSPPSAISNSAPSTNKRSSAKIKRTQQKRIRQNDFLQQKQRSRQQHQPSEPHQQAKQQRQPKKQNQPKKQRQQQKQIQPQPQQPQQKQKQKQPQHILNKPGDLPHTLSGQIHNTLKKSGLPLPSNSYDDRHIHIQRRSTGLKPTMQPSPILNKRRRQDDDTTSWETSHPTARRRRLEREPDRQGTSRGISIRGAALSNRPGSLPQTNHRPFSILGASTRDTFSFVNRTSTPPTSFRPPPDAISFVNRRPTVKPVTQAQILQRLGDGSNTKSNRHQLPSKIKPTFVGGRQISVDAVKY